MSTKKSLSPGMKLTIAVIVVAGFYGCYQLWGGAGIFAWFGVCLAFGLIGVLTNWANALSMDYGFSLLSNRVRILTWLAAGHEAARSTDYDAVMGGFGLGGSYLAPLGLVLGIRGGYEHKNHFGSATGRWGKQRLDNSLDLTLEVGRGLWRGFRLKAIYRRSQHFSTVQSFDSFISSP